MKKIITLLLSGIIMANSFVVSAFAQEIPASNIQAKSEVTVTIKNLNTGEITILKPEDGITSRTVANEDGTYSEKVSADISVETEKGKISPYSSATDQGMTARVTFDLDYLQSGSKFKITRIYGSFQNLDPSFSLTNKLVKVANYDYAQSQYIFTRTNPSNTYSYSNPFSNWADTKWAPVMVGGYARCYTSRGDYNYEVRCTITVVGQSLEGWW